MKLRVLGLFLLLSSVGAAAAQGNSKSLQEATPVKLPPVRIWRVALGYGEPGRQTGLQERTPKAGIERAWRSYLDGDTLASRIELGKWLPDLLEQGETAEVAAALSVANLNDAASSLASGEATTSLADDLTQARPKWREEPSLGSWVDLFDGAAAEKQKATEAAQRNWTAAAAKDAPLRVQGLAQLGLAQLAIDRNATSDALASLHAAEHAFATAGDERGVAAVLILRVTAFSTARDAVKADSTAAAAESYCQRRGLVDGVVESLLAVSNSAKAFGEQEKAARLWARAEDTALRSGLMSVRVLNRGELERLKQYAGENLSLPKSREYFRWAAATGNLTLIEKSSRAVAAALKNKGEMGASGWYGVMAEDAAASLATLPASTRLLHAALIDYGLLEAGVDPGSRPELFAGRGYAAYSRELIAGFKRIEKLIPDNDSDDENQMTSELEGLAKQADRHRESALGALRQSDGKLAAKEFEAFFRTLPPVLKAIAALAAQGDDEKEQAPDYKTAAKLKYAAGLLEAWSMRDPSRLRAMVAALQRAAGLVDAPLLLSAEESSKAGMGNVNGWGSESDSEALGEAVALGRASKRRAWPRLVTRYAAAGGGSAVTAAAFGVEPEKLNEQEGAQFQIAYAGQFALAANGEIPHVQLGGERPFEWLLSKIRNDYSLKRDIEQASMFGVSIRVMQMAYLSTEGGAARLANTKNFQSIIAEEPDMPDFDSLDDEDSEQNDATGEATTGESDTPPKGFLRGFEFSVWSMQYPVLLNAVVRPESPYLERAMSDALADMVSPSSLNASFPQEGVQELREIKNTKRSIVLDLALSALAGKRYGEAIERLSKFEGMMPSPTTLERVQVKYVMAICYRGLADALQEEALLQAAGVELEGLRRSVATRNASLRLRDLRQLIQEEYLSALYRRGDWTGMARAIAAYRQASVLPAAILAAAPRRQLAQELETLKDTYDALAAGAEKSPVTRQAYRELFKLFEQPERLPSGDPTLNAIEQATYLVTDELYAETPGDTHAGAVIRPAARGELLILQSVGHTGVFTVTIDEHGRTSGYYRYMPIASLEALCQDFEKALQAEGPSAEAGAQLYEKLLAYLPEMTGKRRLSILADGPLLNLAWAALPTPNGQYLIEKYEIGILSGVKPASGSSAPMAREQTLVISNPDSDVDATGQLPAIGDGARSGIIKLEGVGATLPNIQRALTRADAVYISTHAQSDYLRPDYSFLELAAGRRLYSLDLGNLDFSGRRLLLSACETRTGKTYPGEEAYGLADAFLARNASTVVATRWRVEAPAAYAFSAAFYGSLHDGGDYTAAATRAARSLLEGKRSEWRAARHWAAYEPVTRFLDPGQNPTRLTQGTESLDLAETAGIVKTLQGDRKQAEMETQRLKEKETALTAELTELEKIVTQEENRNSALDSQVSVGRRTGKWAAAALKTAKTALEANPDWKPAERLRLIVRLKDESGSAVPGAVVSAQDVALQKQITRSTDSEGNAVFPDIRAAAAYKIDASARGFVVERSLYDDDLDAWFGDAEKVVTMRPVNDTAEEDENPGPKKKPAIKAMKKSAARKPPQVILRPVGPVRVLLGEINRTEALNDTMAPNIAQLESERTEAKEALERKTQEHQNAIEQIDEFRGKIDKESRELNAILTQVGLTELQREPLEISGTVEDSHFHGVRAKVTLERVGAGVEAATSSDESGHFVLAGATPGVEYVVVAEAAGHTAWRSLPMSFYFPCSLFVLLQAPGDPTYRRRTWW